MKSNAQQTSRIGILGGVGARASARLHQRFVEEWARLHTPDTDDGFPEILHLSTAIPGLTEEGVRDERAVLEHFMTVLPTFKAAKCHQLVLACNNLHPFKGWVQWATGADRVLTPVDAVVRKMQRDCWSQAYVLQSRSMADGTAYGHALAAAGCDYTTASPEMQEMLDALIAALLSGRVFEGSRALVDLIVKEKPQDAVVVLGCTELSLWRPALPFDVIDSNDALCELMLEQA